MRDGAGWFTLLLLATASACAGASTHNEQPADSGESQPENDAAADAGSDDAGMAASDASAAGDASAARDASTGDASSMNQDDGTPMRMQCTGQFGNALSLGFGRMDGILVSVIPNGGPHACNGDQGHVHLQVLINGSVYDVAVNTDTYQTTRDLAIPGQAWTEGWHTGLRFDYTDLGYHASDFASVADASGAIEAFVQRANHVTIYATGYGPTGAHDVHRSTSGGHDGAIFIDPLSSPSHAMLFRFNNQTF